MVRAAPLRGVWASRKVTNAGGQRKNRRCNARRQVPTLQGVGTAHVNATTRRVSPLAAALRRMNRARHITSVVERAVRAVRALWLAPVLALALLLASAGWRSAEGQGLRFR